METQQEIIVPQIQICLERQILWQRGTPNMWRPNYRTLLEELYAYRESNIAAVYLLFRRLQRGKQAERGKWVE